MTTPEDFEAELRVAMHEAVDEESTPAHVRSAVLASLTDSPVVAGADPAWFRRPAPLLAAAAIVALVALVGSLLTGGSADRSTDVAAHGFTPSALTTTTRPGDQTFDTVPATTTTTAPTTVPAPDPTVTVSAAAPTLPTTPAPTIAAVEGPKPTVAPPTPACRNSTSPTCGPFRWDPQPNNRPATAEIRLPEGPIVAGVDYAVVLAITDPDGPVGFDCYDFDGPSGDGVVIGGSCTIERVTCPERHGPWTPPAPRGATADLDRTIRFDQPGRFTLTLTVHIPETSQAYCANVNPYLSASTRTITVDVVAAP